MITYTKDLTITANGIPPVVRISQYSDDFGIVFYLKDTDGLLNIQSGTTATVRGTKVDGNGYSANATIDIANKTVTVSGHKQMTAVAGENVFEVVLWKGEKELASTNFVLLVEPAAMDANTVPSESMIKEIDEAVDEYFATHDIVTDPTLSISGRPADAAATGDAVADLKEDIGKFRFYQNKKARQMTVALPCSIGDRFYFKPITWSGDTWTQISVQGLYNGSYTTLVRATALNQEHYFVVDKQYESFLISVNVSAVPTVNTTFEFILCNTNDLTNLAGYVANNDYNKFKFRGYLPVNANVNTIVQCGWYLLASARISGTTGLPDDISKEAVFTVYNGDLTLQTLQELSWPYRYYQRYLYSNNQNQSVWTKKCSDTRARTAYLFGDSLTKGVLGTGGNGTSYLEQALTFAGYKVVNCGVGGIGYVYSAKKLVSEVPWNIGEGRIRAQDVINHYASELTNADTVVLAYGVNDWQTLGDTRTTIAEADRRATSSNITANVKTAIETIMTANNGARIIVVTPVNNAYRGGSIASKYALETSLDNNGDGREAMTLEKTYQAIVDACDYYGVNYIDMTHNNATVNYLNITDVLPDKLHPSQTTYNRLAESIVI